MKRNFIFVLAAALLLAPWPIVYAYEGVNADTNITDIMPADPAAAPQMKAYGNAVGHVGPGDLFQIDTTGTQIDTRYELIITNVDELASDYRFMNLKVGIFVQTAEPGRWERLQEANGEQVHDIYITMFGDKVDFTLPGGAVYKIVIDTGCFYCYAIKPGDTVALPTFYITAS